MKEGYKEWFGKTIELTGEAAIHWVESAVSEGYSGPAGYLPEGGPNLFGRTPKYAITSKLDFVAGLGAAGLRAAAFLPADALAGQAGQLSTLSRQHSSLVVHMATQALNASVFDHTAGRRLFAALAGTGAFQLLATNAQEALDFAIISHKVAELALIPGVNAMDIWPTAVESQAIDCPTKEMLVQFLGSSDDQIACPTPAQEMLFGKKRRRVPNWFNLDFPALNGARKDEPAISLESAAQQRYFYHHLPAIIGQVMGEYSRLAGRDYAPVMAYRAEDADFLILTMGAAFASAKAAVDYLRSQEKARVGCLNLSLFRPFPAEMLAGLLDGKQGVAVLETLGGADDAINGPVFIDLKAATAGLGKRQPESFSGRYASSLSREGAIAVFRNMLKGGQRKKNFFLDIDFTRPTSASPQQQLLLQAIERNYPNIGEMTLHSSTASDVNMEKGPAATLAAPVMPRTVRRYQDHGAPYTRLSRFFHDTASFYQSGKQEELVASPFEALAQSPAASALFMEMDARRVELPVFLPQSCTGCGQCTMVCPHAAIPPLAIGVESLVKGAMAIAASRGRPVAQITPLVKNLSRLAGPAVKSAAENATRVMEMLPAAFDRLLEQMKITGDKEATVRQEWAILLDIIGEWPVAVTETFFLEAEAREKGSGEFFTLAINPYACTGCGICAEACAEGALEMKPQELPLVQSLQATYGLWEQLPDTSSETISRLVHDPAYDSFAAILLSRNYYQSMAGGSLTESGAPAKGILHLVAALTESIVQPRIVKLAREAGELIEALQENIHGKLSNALPREDLLALEKAVGESAGSSLPLDELVSKLGAREHLKLVDTAVLHRKIALANDLKALRWSMLEGPTGAGRARFGLVLQAGLWPWAEQYPYNSFLAPVLLDGEGASAGLASGLFQGHLRHALDNIKLLRRARLEAKDKYRPEADGPEIAALGWEALDEAERGLVPPLLLVGNQSLLEGPQREALDALLASPWPIKIFCLDEAAPAEEETARQLARGNAALFAAAALRNAYVWQGSLGASRELFDGLRQGISRPRPAIYHLLAVNPEVHEGYERQWPRLASLALDTRAFPLFTFDPETEDGFLSLATSLSGNPWPDADWGENNAQQYQLTYADWLYTLRAWQSHFRPLSTEDAAALPVGDYLNLSPDARKGKIPVIQTAGEKGQIKKLVVSQQVVAATDAARHQWRMLREMAGTLTPFPGKLRKQVEQELTEKYERELAQLRSDYEEKLQNQEQELMQQVRIKLRDKLVSLSKTPRS